MNAGATLEDILSKVKVPAGYLAKPYLLPKYDDPEFLVRSIYHFYAGWFDGNAAHLKPARTAELAAELADLAATWHFIGQVQSKKARQVRSYVDVIHSVDRPSLVDALAGGPLDVFIQVNLTDDPARGGAQPDDLESLAERVASTEGLRLRGLMAVAPLESEPRREFARVRALSERLRAAHPEASGLSMGMSGDFREAILEGATHLRIGTAITGNRLLHG